MKKAKIFLTALIVLATVGGLLASKIKNPHTFASCDPFAGVCTFSPFLTFQKTTNMGLKAYYDDYGKPCITENGLLTCTTLVTFAQ